MPLVIAYDEAKANQSRIEGDDVSTSGGMVNIGFFGSRHSPDSPQAIFAKWDRGRYSSAHFHTHDQFQVVIAGKGQVGRHALAAYDVHFARAYTPYGPLLSDAASTFSFFVLRVRPDPGARRLPELQEELKRVPDRRPWQIRRSVKFPVLSSETADMMESIPDVRDDQGLAAYAITMKPNSRRAAPDPSHGAGQYLVITSGSLWYGNSEHKAPALAFVEPHEAPLDMRSGAEGLQGMILNFPKSAPRSGHAGAAASAAGTKKWQCALCAFTYDEALGLPEEGIPAGTRWEDLPDQWTCPDCSAMKGDFQVA